MMATRMQGKAKNIYIDSGKMCTLETVVKKDSQTISLNQLKE